MPKGNKITAYAAVCNNCGAIKGVAVIEGNEEYNREELTHYLPKKRGGGICGYFVRSGGDSGDEIRGYITTSTASESGEWFRTFGELLNSLKAF